MRIGVSFVAAQWLRVVWVSDPYGASFYATRNQLHGSVSA